MLVPLLISKMAQIFLAWVNWLQVGGESCLHLYSIGTQAVKLLPNLHLIFRLHAGGNNYPFVPYLTGDLLSKKEKHVLLLIKLLSHQGIPQLLYSTHRLSNNGTRKA